MQAKLIPLDGGDPIEILKDLTVIGRKEDSDLRLDHKSVSKLHCVLVKTEGGMLFVRDLGSTNGTRVNGTRVRRAGLLPNDQLAVASYKFKVALGERKPEKAAGSQFTQQIEADEFRRRLGKARKRIKRDIDLQANPLPDVYPDDQQKT